MNTEPCTIVVAERIYDGRMIWEAYCRKHLRWTIGHSPKQAIYYLHFCELAQMRKRRIREIKIAGWFFLGWFFFIVADIVLVTWMRGAP